MIVTPEIFTDYLSRGFALCRIPHGCKTPRDKDWPLKPVQSPDGFSPVDNIGMLLGPLSTGIVCVDLDFHSEDEEAWRVAIAALPHTGLVDGRPGKPSAHRYYRLSPEPVPDSVLPTTSSAVREAMDSGLISRFPGTRHWSNSAGRGVDLLGAGAQVVIPPSVHESGDRREWLILDEPGEVSYTLLVQCIENLAAALGLQGRVERDAKDGVSASSDMFDSSNVDRLNQYLLATPALAHGQGQGYHAQQWRVACKCVELGVPYNDAIPLYLAWGAKSTTPDDTETMRSTLQRAYQSTAPEESADLSGLIRSEHPKLDEPPKLDAEPPKIGISFQWFSDTEELPLEWLWPTVIPKGLVCLLAGKQGLGKSFVLCYLAATVSTGGVMPDGTKTTAGKVLMLVREDDPQRVLIKRLKAAGADLTKVGWSTFSEATSHQPLNLAEHIESMISWAKTEGFSLIVVDTYSSFAAAGTDQNAAGDVRVLVDALGRLAMATGAAVMLTAHLRKSGAGDGGDAMDAVAGSVQFTAGVRVTIMLEKGLQTGVRRVRVVKTNLGEVDELGWVWHFGWPDPFTEGVAEMPRLVWSAAGEEYSDEQTMPNKGGQDDEPGQENEEEKEATLDAIMALVSDNPTSLNDVLAAFWDSRAVRKVIDDALKLGQLATWKGAHGAVMLGIRGQDPETRARLLAQENPNMSVRELREACGCAKDTAMIALREARSRPAEEIEGQSNVFNR